MIFAFTSPIVGLFLVFPAFVLIAVFASVYYLIRGSLFQVGFVGPSPMSKDGKPQGSQSVSASDAMNWIAATYLFWVAVSFANFELLFFLVLAPLGLFIPYAVGEFLQFILPPLAVALAVGAIVTQLFVKRLRVNRRMTPFIFNACVLLTFFVSAEVFRSYLMSESLLGHKPSHLYSSSFMRSVLSYRPDLRGAHASFDENGYTYLWSYSERRFVQTP